MIPNKVEVDRLYPVWDKLNYRLRAGIACDGCGKTIERADGLLEGETYYETEDGNLCERCFDRWCREHRRECV